MARLSECSPRVIEGFGDGLKAPLGAAPHLQSAAQEVASRLYNEFVESVVLARAYVTLPLNQLPQADRAFAQKLAAGAGQGTLADDTLILSLMGTAGVDAKWADRRLSEGHLAIPLVSAPFVASIPMVARLMKDMGIGLEWLDTRNTEVVVKKLGNVAGVFYVQDARTSVDDQGRRIVPAKAFVDGHGVRTVFGLGGCYMNGAFLAIIVFTRESIPRPQVESLLPLVSTVKAATTGLVISKRYFG